MSTSDMSNVPEVWLSISDFAFAMIVWINGVDMYPQLHCSNKYSASSEGTFTARSDSAHRDCLCLDPPCTPEANPGLARRFIARTALDGSKLEPEL